MWKVMDLRSAFDIPAPAIVLAEGSFGEPDGKTANGIVMHSELFDVKAVVDSERAGRTTSEVLSTDIGDTAPVVTTMEQALEVAPTAEVLVIGVAPAGGELPPAWSTGIHRAIEHGCDIVSGLHSFLSEDPEWQARAANHGVTIHDVRKPPNTEELTVASGAVDTRDTPVVLTMGTDCAVGKRTTTFELYKTAQRHGIDAGWVATGQTGIMVGAHQGVVIDRVPADFTAGVVESMVTDVAGDHDLVFVEGQAALHHRAYSGVTLSILHGAWPDAIVLADDPDRDRRTHYEQFPIAGVEREIDAIEQLTETDVVALSTWGDPDRQKAIHGIPTVNVLTPEGPSDLLTIVRESVSV